MSWHFTSDPAVLRAAAGPHLAADPARNTAVLTLMESAPRLGWWTEPDGRVTGVVAVPRPGLPSLGVTTEAAARALVLPDGTELRELRGETAAVEAYREATGRTGTVLARTRLFRLGEPVPPDPAPHGRARLATAADLPLLRDWTTGFARAIGEEPEDDYTGFLTARVSEARLHLWETPDGRPVSMAAVSRTVGGQARVHLVYTPPADRGHGYAAGVTDALGRAALDAGAAHVLLFTDLANPTSNALYRRLGYRPVTDHLGIRFTGPTPLP
ncbi:GNAT family N-acetyltransferase [Streptomyces sp. G2]|uniref:GNAT family N-acetyltransferase n=1 Tax=Streptomyces TaxID=1883 RepID=UPI002030056E|nr:GNAT family N-acetyltransferase [Streptomyces sp. G2]MCM1950542.1 GNAT family N-acetyltransferase [Streptomyces sp. G2]